MYVIKNSQLLEPAQPFITDQKQSMGETVRYSKYTPALFMSEPTQQRTPKLLKRSSGRSQITYTGLHTKNVGFLRDIYTTVINAKWWVILVVFTLAYLVSWFFFGGLWYAANKNKNFTCLVEVDSYSAAFLFSVEVQATIGFGNKYIKSNCIEGILLLVLQSLLSILITSVFGGLVYAKVVRPRNRRKTLLFSEKAVLYEKNGEKVFEFRVGNLRHDGVVECHVRLQLYLPRFVDGMYQLEQFDLDVGYSNGRDRLFLLTPVVITHHITPGSPLYNLSPRDMAEMDFEIVVVLEGAVEATGLTAQALWSYTKDDIVFDQKFKSMLSRSHKWTVDFSHFSETVPISFNNHDLPQV